MVKHKGSRIIRHGSRYSGYSNEKLDAILKNQKAILEALMVKNIGKNKLLQRRLKKTRELV